MHKKTTGLLLAGVIAGMAVSAYAQDSGALQQPQWSQTFRFRADTAERPLQNLHGSWLRLSDGTHLIAARDLPGSNGVRLRALEADGRERFALPLEPESYAGEAVVQLAHDAIGGGAFVLSDIAGDGYPARLDLLQPDGTRLWQQAMPEGVGDAKQLAAYGNDAVLVLQDVALQAIDRSGNLRWAFYPGQNENLLHHSSVAFDRSSGTTWLAGSGGLRGAPDGGRLAAVRRFDASGTLLSLDTFLCSQCSQSRVTAIDLLPDGEAVVAGRSGEGEPGFVAFYHADGTLRLRVETLPGTGYDRLVHDSLGTIYAFSASDSRVVMLGRDGSVLWQREGDDMAALDQGVLVSRPFPRRAGPLTIEAHAFGQLRWTRQIDSSDGLRVGGALSDNGRITLLAQINRGENGCGIAPRAITLNSHGVVLGEVRGCSVPVVRSISGTSADPGGGIVGNLQGTLVQLSPDAERRWRYPACPACVADASTLAGASHVYVDGSAWITLAKSAPSALGPRRALLRIGADGSVLSETEFPAMARSTMHAGVVLADADRAIDIAAHASGLSWSRVSADGVLQETRSIGLPGSSDTVDILNSRLWPDGSVSLVTARRNVLGCQGSPPSPVSCTPALTTLLRLDADGSERWRVELGQGWPFVGLNPDGSSLAFSVASLQPVRARHIDAGGNAGATSDVGTLSSDFSFAGLGPVRGNYLISTGSDLYLLDSQATILALRPGDNDACCRLYAHGEYGFLVSSVNADAALLSADDLSLTARFDLDGMANTSLQGGRWFWHLFDDGSIYSSIRQPAEYSLSGRLSRFAVPGSPAYDRVFLDRFD